MTPPATWTSWRLEPEKRLATGSELVMTCATLSPRCFATWKHVVPPSMITFWPGRTSAAQARPMASLAATSWVSRRWKTNSSPFGAWARRAPPWVRRATPRSASAATSRRTVETEVPTRRASSSSEANSAFWRWFAMRDWRSSAVIFRAELEDVGRYCNAPLTFWKILGVTCPPSCRVWSFTDLPPRSTRATPGAFARPRTRGPQAGDLGRGEHVGAHRPRHLHRESQRGQPRHALAARRDRMPARRTRRAP